MPSRAIAHRGALLWRHDEPFGECCFIGGDVSGRYQPSGALGGTDPGWSEHGLGRRADVGGDHGAAHRLGLGGGAAERFRLDRGDNSHMRQMKRRRNVLDVADNLDAVADAVSGSQRSDLVTISVAALGIASEHEDDIREPRQ